MNRRIALALARIAFGALALWAVGEQLTTHIRLGYNVVNFFSYYTNLSNIFAAFVFLIGGTQLLRRASHTQWLDFLRATSVVMMMLVGVVFNILLRNVELGSLAPWVNIVVHMLMPVVVVVDWWLDLPNGRIHTRTMLTWLAVPVVYVCYSLVRGAQKNWYPYPFFNPAVSGGYSGVAAYCAGMLVALLEIAAFVMWTANRALRPPVTSAT